MRHRTSLPWNPTLLITLGLFAFWGVQTTSAQMIIAHRGASAVAPENTVAAFKLAWEKGADGIEGDFYLTRDGQIVTIHDATTKRTADVDLVVAESTLAELRKLDVGSWKSEVYVGERIPTLAEVLAVVPPGKKIFIEVKCGPEIVPELKKVLDASGLEPSQTIVIAFDEKVIVAIKKQIPQIKAYWLTSYKQDEETGQWSPTIDSLLKTLKSTGADGLDTQGNRDVIDAEFVKRLRAADMAFHVWTVDESDEASLFQRLGVDSITTNLPEIIRQSLESPDLKEEHQTQASVAGKQDATQTREEAEPQGKVVRVLVDQRLENPVNTIAKEFQRRTGVQTVLTFQPAAKVNEASREKTSDFDAVLCMTKRNDSQTVFATLPGAAQVAWKLGTGQPVWGAALGKKKNAAEFVRFAGGPTGHRFWSESTAGFTIVSGKSHAEAIEWITENRVKQTYPLTAARMLTECGGIREGVCIDIGCGPGELEIELAKRSNLTIIGLDIDAEMKPLFDKRIRAAGFQDRVRFVAGDAQDMPFEDNSADIIISRGTLTFIPDIAKCLQEVHRVLKPSGVAFLGGRYIYTPQKDKISTEKLRQIVADSGVPGAEVVTFRGQWVKIIGPDAPQAASKPAFGPHMLINRFTADYAITQGDCLLVCANDSASAQRFQNGFVNTTNLNITALYPSKKIASEAEKRIKEGGMTDRIVCKVGKLDGGLPFEVGSFDLIAGVGPGLIWGDRVKKMQDIYRVLRPGGVALFGGKFLGMPAARRVSSDTLRASATQAGISSIRVIDDGGQWVEIRKGMRDRGHLEPCRAQER